ncbi:hypothetical protein RxyAA322_22050 [Rubrobacter xylanophilus]|uniref:Uncharacterized protein n=1 Tax=Rubrobacter xylanophilus TaxID=49319 RepID=A0A510HK01_9ACTN|nr:heavy metal-binding domain-containing protein [Rubrobacter xylanophilus]BBL80351.1 hypothetical protein RxyAA322_22050 [Rubrobacter xylanophilus]
MISGARQGDVSGLRRLFAAAMARDLRAFVVPGAEVARARGLDPEAVGLRITAAPRHANVLVIVGELPEGLRKAAAVTYAQMMRPRAVLAVGAEELFPLPEADVSAELSQAGLEEGVARLRRAFSRGAFAPETADFEPETLHTKTEYTCPMHPEVVQDEPGTCPKCGMDLVPREAQQEQDGGHEDHDHGEEDHHGHEEHEEGSPEEHDDGSENGDHEGRSHEEMDHGDHGGHEGMDHGDMDFMSMVEMTKDLPRSSDGLQMEWVETPFGPLFPGLPAGLSLTLTLDGDTVAEVQAASAVEGWVSTGDLAGPAASFPDRLAGLAPLSPVAYRVLALRAVENAAGAVPDERTTLARVGAMERERAASHLNWLASFAHLLGYSWLEERARELQIALLRAAGPEDVARLAGEAKKLVRRVERTPLLRRRLGGIGTLPADAEASGPVARAGGSAADVRTNEKTYRELGFETVVLDGNDALSRLRVRLTEVGQSLELAGTVSSVDIPDPVIEDSRSGTGAATVETPRGPATLRATLEDGEVVGVELDTPSTRLIPLVHHVVQQQELADALVGVASLDISPWEVIQ